MADAAHTGPAVDRPCLLPAASPSLQNCFLCDSPQAERFAFTCPGYSDKDPLPAKPEQAAEVQKGGDVADAASDEAARFQEAEQAAEETL